METIRKLALKYPETAEGIACKGTAVECKTVQVRNKAFVFLGTAAIKLKLRESLAEAAELESQEPARYKVGSVGWVDVKFSKELPLPLEILKRWIDESYRLFAPKQLLAQLPEHERPVGKSPQPTHDAPRRGSAKRKSTRRD